MLKSFDTQLEDCLSDLWRYAWSLTRDRDAADDLLQDCLERALRKRSLWLPVRPLKPWLTTMMLNLYRDDWRRNNRHPLVDLEKAGDIPAPISSAEDRLELQAIWSNVAKLPQEQRDALLLVVSAGLSYAEAAKVLNIPRGTLMSRISRARRKLKSEIDASGLKKIRSIK